MVSQATVPGWAYKLLRRDLEAGPQDVKALARYPGGTLLAFLTLHQGLAFSSLRLAINGGGGSSVASRVAGVAAAAVLALGGAALVAVVHAASRALTAGELGYAYVRNWPVAPVGNVVHRRPGLLPRLLLWGNGDWVSRTRTNHWAVRYQSVVRQFSTGAAAPGVAAELATQWGQALVAALPTPTWRHCGHARVVALLTLLAHAAWLLGGRPFRKPCDCLLVPLLLGLQAAASAVQAWGFYSYVISSEVCGSTCELAVPCLLSAASAVLLLRVALTHAGTATLLVTGRRSQMQRLEWQEHDSGKRAPSAKRDSSSDSTVCHPLASPHRRRRSHTEAAATGLPLLQHAAAAGSLKGACTRTLAPRSQGAAGLGALPTAAPRAPPTLRLLLGGDRPVTPLCPTTTRGPGEAHRIHKGTLALTAPSRRARDVSSTSIRL
eukprot:TRINITY_DN16388_c0_g1_i2.p1 TRINITY_DN16388_c0_g1~~TRINITY_DN16388_c0_g1_i2.p1  ORF type:complete len:436 (+),score=42.97 TRINITY_DN16388_c0_g1_i2:453-1760(+)